MTRTDGRPTICDPRSDHVQHSVKVPDAEVRNVGSFFLLSALTVEARRWCDEYLNEPLRWGTAYVIEPRYIDDIVTGLEVDGFTVQ